MIDVLPPFVVYIIGALLVPLIPAGRLRSTFMLLIPVIGAWMIWQMPTGVSGVVQFFGFDLTLLRVDKLAVIFALVFSLAGFLANLYAWHLRDTMQQVATLLYAGSAIGAVFVGDLISLFFFWEGTAIASVFLIWARRTEGAFWTGMRYLIIQIASGVILIGGVALYYHSTGSIGFDAMTLPMTSPTTWGALEIGLWLIFLAFGIKCAFPLLHNWLSDAYPAATVTGTVILSAFTTKVAVYALARGFAGTEILVYIGAVMALFPIVFAIIENDLRRTLAYLLNIQLGFMVVGIGVGTELALSGAISHAVASVIYQSLLFMSVGAVIYRTGKSKVSELGGLYRTMPLTAILCLLGAASVSAMPFLSGFVTKSMTVSAVAKQDYMYVWLALILSSTLVVIHSGVKIVVFTFFAQDSGMRPKEAPTHMLWAMGLTALASLLVGIFPTRLYDLLPYAVDYHPYTIGHVSKQVQLVMFAILAFTILKLTKFYPPVLKSITLDFDWTYRRFLPSILRYVAFLVGSGFAMATNTINTFAARMVHRLHHSHGPDGSRAASWPAGAMVMSIAAVLGLALFVIFFS